MKCQAGSCEAAKRRGAKLQCRKGKGVEGRRTKIAHVDGSRAECLLATAIDCRRWRRGKILHCMLCLEELSNLSNGQKKKPSKHMLLQTDASSPSVVPHAPFPFTLLPHSQRFHFLLSRWMDLRASEPVVSRCQDGPARCCANYFAISRWIQRCTVVEFWAENSRSRAFSFFRSFNPSRFRISACLR